MGGKSRPITDLAPAVVRTRLSRSMNWSFGYVRVTCNARCWYSLMLPSAHVVGQARGANGKLIPSWCCLATTREFCRYGGPPYGKHVAKSISHMSSPCPLKMHVQILTLVPDQSARKMKRSKASSQWSIWWENSSIPDFKRSWKDALSANRCRNRQSDYFKAGWIRSMISFMKLLDQCTPTSRGRSDKF